MSGHAFTGYYRFEPGKVCDVVDLTCGADVVAARLTLVSEDDQGTRFSHGWVVRTADGVDQYAFGRTLHPTEPHWAHAYQTPDVAISAPGLTFRWDEWIDGGIRLASTSKATGGGEYILATLFTDGHFGIRNVETEGVVSEACNGEEYLAQAANLFCIGGGGYHVVHSVSEELPVSASSAMIQNDPGVGLAVFTDWRVRYQPVRIGQGTQQNVVSARDPVGRFPDLATLVCGSVDLPLGEFDEGTTAGGLTLMSATYADKNLGAAGYAVSVGADAPKSQGHFSFGTGTHKSAPKKQTVVVRHYGWKHDEWEFETTSQIKANWLAALWYAPTAAKPPTAAHEGVTGVLR